MQKQQFVWNLGLGSLDPQVEFKIEFQFHVRNCLVYQQLLC